MFSEKGLNSFGGFLKETKKTSDKTTNLVWKIVLPILLFFAVLFYIIIVNIKWIVIGLICICAHVFIKDMIIKRKDKKNNPENALEWDEENRRWININIE